jgi:hypothetical protein
MCNLPVRCDPIPRLDAQAEQIVAMYTETPEQIVGAVRVTGQTARSAARRRSA